MSAPIYKTKGELRAELLIALGYGGLGSAAGAFVPRADYLLESAQENLYLLMPDEKRKREWFWTTSVNETWYDIPADCDVDRIIQMSTFFEQTWLPMTRGIGIYHDSTFDYINYYPQRYDFGIRGNDGLPGNTYETTEQHVNADLSVSSLAAESNGSNGEGFSWDNLYWQIRTNNTMRCISNGTSTVSSQEFVEGVNYDIEYTIDSGSLNNASFGGVPLTGLTVGTHTRTVKALSKQGFYFNGQIGMVLSAFSVKHNVVQDANTDIEVDNSPAQFEFWPTDSTTTYRVKVEGFMQLMPFVADGDRATIDDRLILLYAEAYGKAHLNKPDAGFVMQALERRLKLLRGQQHGEQRYVRGEPVPEPIPRPIVIP